jgi:hypothetical protein
MRLRAAIFKIRHSPSEVRNDATSVWGLVIPFIYVVDGGAVRMKHWLGDHIEIFALPWPKHLGFPIPVAHAHSSRLSRL